MREIEYIDHLIEWTLAPAEDRPGVAYYRNPRSTPAEREEAGRLIGQISDAEAEVKAQVSQPAARKAICKALKSLSGDTWDIAKGMTGALAALALTGAITIPAVPFAIAIAAIVVARMGAAALCAEDEG